MLIGIMMSSIFIPNLVAQRDKFGEIECTGQKVVDADGKEMVSLSVAEIGGEIAVSMKDEESILLMNGWNVALNRKNGNSASLNVTNAAGSVSVEGKNGSSVSILAPTHDLAKGGTVLVTGEDR